MLGDSVRRRLGPRARSRPEKTPKKRRWGWKLWVALLVVLTLPFLIGYLVAVRTLFPPPPVVAAGIAVPNVVGADVATAQRSVVEAGLGQLSVSDLPSLSAPEGQIIAQSPLPGQQLRASAPVRVAVSSGPPRVFVPDVVGFPVERAASLLVRLGFQVERHDSVASADAGRIVEVNPEPGSQLRLPARVAIIVSTGMPDTIPTDTLMLRDTTARPVGWSEGVRDSMLSGVQVFTPIGEVRTNGRE